MCEGRKDPPSKRSRADREAVTVDPSSRGGSAKAGGDRKPLGLTMSNQSDFVEIAALWKGESKAGKK